MEKIKPKNDLSGKIKTALDNAVKKIVAEEKEKGGYIVVSDGQGNVKKIPAKDL